MRRNTVHSNFCFALLCFVLVGCNTKSTPTSQEATQLKLNSLSQPKSTADCKLVNHLAYSLCYSEEHEQALWVSYQLTRRKARGGHKRKNNFRADPMIATESAQLDDYRGTGIDRGHLAPAGDMKWSKDAMSQSFFMSNIAPQHREFNRGIWKSLENRVRNWAIEKEELYIITGPVFNGEEPKIGESGVTVPSGFYKVVIDAEQDELKVAAFLLPNAGSDDSLEHWFNSVDDVELQTGLDFFGSLPDGLESKVESILDKAHWGLMK
jgi:endonuclease G, mitochondrial